MPWKTLVKVAVFVIFTAAQAYCERQSRKLKS